MWWNEITEFECLLEYIYFHCLSRVGILQRVLFLVTNVEAVRVRLHGLVARGNQDHQHVL